MELTRPPRAVARAGVRALKTVALADGTFHALERDWIASVQANILGTDFDLDALEPIDGAELARLVPVGDLRERILRGAILVALIDTEASAKERDVIAGFARALGVDPAPLTDLERIVDGRMALLRLDVARRSFIGKRIGFHAETKGLRGMADVVRSFAGFENPALAARYVTLEHKPAGTLGRAYWEFIKGNEFGLPGEKNGAPEPIVFHDCVHVMAEYDTTPGEEVQVVAFQAGFQKYDPFFTMLFVVAQFHLGIEISPIAGTTKLAIDPDAMLRALMRGTQCKRDFSDRWDPWSDFDAPVAELRKRYNILPRS